MSDIVYVPHKLLSGINIPQIMQSFLYRSQIVEF